MKKLLIIISAILLISEILYAQEVDPYDSFKGSFSMYNISTETIVINKIESQTDKNTEKVMIGGLALKFEYLDSNLNMVNDLQVASVHFSDKENKYILDYYVDGYNVVKIILFSKNDKYINKELYSVKEDSTGEEEKTGK